MGLLRRLRLLRKRDAPRNDQTWDFWEMLGIHDFGLFIAAGLLLIVTPGPDTAYVVGRSMQMGWRAGCTAALGISSGCFIHVVAAAVGLSALLAASATAFLAVKLIGAAYLVYISIKMIVSRLSAGSMDSAIKESVSLWQIYWQGVLTDALNPKVAMFFLAFLPQFVEAETPHKALAFLLLGSLFVVMGTLWCIGIATFAATAGGRVRSSDRAMQWINRALGIFFVGLGIRVAMTQSR